MIGLFPQDWLHWVSNSPTSTAVFAQGWAAADLLPSRPLHES